MLYLVIVRDYKTLYMYFILKQIIDIMFYCGFFSYLQQENEFLKYIFTEDEDSICYMYLMLSVNISFRN